MSKRNAKLNCFQIPVINAARTYLMREWGLDRPEGGTDSGGRWYPKGRDTIVEKSSIREPSRAYPWSYYKACFTVKHCAALHGADATQARRLVKLAGDLQHQGLENGQVVRITEQDIDTALFRFSEQHQLEQATAPATGERCAARL